MKDKKPKVQHEAKEVRVTVSRTVQIRQYEPVTVTVTETHDVLEGESTQVVRNAAYNSVSAAVLKYVDHEIENYGDSDK